MLKDIQQLTGLTLAELSRLWLLPEGTLYSWAKRHQSPPPPFRDALQQLMQCVEAATENQLQALDEHQREMAADAIEEFRDQYRQKLLYRQLMLRQKHDHLLETQRKYLRLIHLSQHLQLTDSDPDRQIQYQQLPQLWGKQARKALSPTFYTQLADLQIKLTQTQAALQALDEMT